MAAGAQAAFAGGDDDDGHARAPGSRRLHSAVSTERSIYRRGESAGNGGGGGAGAARVARRNFDANFDGRGARPGGRPGGEKVVMRLITVTDPQAPRPARNRPATTAPSRASACQAPPRAAAMLGLSGVGTVLGAVMARKKLESLELKEDANMPFLYWLAVVGAFMKPKWTASKTWPALKVRGGRGGPRRGMRQGRRGGSGARAAARGASAPQRARRCRLR
jgi:hypothetical protein